MGCLGSRQKIKLLVRDCQREIRGCDTIIQKEEVTQSKARLEMQRYARKQQSAQAMGAAKTVVKSVQLQVTMMRVKEQIKGIETLLQDAGATVAVQDVTRKFQRILSSVNNDLSVDETIKVTQKLQLDHAKLQKKMEIIREAMDDARETTGTENESAGLVDEAAAGMDEEEIARALLEEFQEKELMDLPAPPQARRKPQRGEPLVSLDAPVKKQ